MIIKKLQRAPFPCGGGGGGRRYHGGRGTQSAQRELMYIYRERCIYTYITIWGAKRVGEPWVGNQEARVGNKEARVGNKEARVRNLGSACQEQGSACRELGGHHVRPGGNTAQRPARSHATCLSANPT